MKNAKRLTIFVIGLVAILGAAQETKDVFGVPIYPGAKLDEATTKSLAEMLGGEAKAFRTADPVAKVAAFYKAKGLIEIMVAEEGAMYKKGDTVDVTIQRPWQNTQTGSMEKDTLISIVKHD